MAALTEKTNKFSHRGSNFWTCPLRDLSPNPGPGIITLHQFGVILELQLFKLSHFQLPVPGFYTGSFQSDHLCVSGLTNQRAGMRGSQDCHGSWCYYFLSVYSGSGSNPSIHPQLPPMAPYSQFWPGLLPGSCEPFNKIHISPIQAHCPLCVFKSVRINLQACYDFIQTPFALSSSIFHVQL